MIGVDHPRWQADGFVHIRDFISQERLAEFGSVLVDLYRMQADKIAGYRGIIPSAPGNEAKLAAILEAMEATDKEALYQVQKMFPSSELRNLFFCKFRDMLAEMLGTTRSKLLIEGPSLFINRPGTDRLLYRWHSEAHYYPKRRRFVNLWMPLFTEKNPANGAMVLIPGSHKQDWPFAEYQQGAHHFVQYEIPENVLRERLGRAENPSVLPIHWCISRPGDLILFHRNLVHSSTKNETGRTSFAIVARAWVPEDDLTLSGAMAATPYGGDIGRQGMMVRGNVE